MKSRPILFSAPMVRAVLDGSKTQTRRVIKYDGVISSIATIEQWARGLASNGCFGRSITEADIAQKIEQLKGRIHPFFNESGSMLALVCPYGKPGDRLWVRETWRCNGWATDVATIFYKASERNSYTEMCEQFPIAGKDRLEPSSKWKPSIHMPRWASRITLEIVDVRVERVREMFKGNDLEAEGISQLLEDEESIAGRAFNRAEHYAITGAPGMKYSAEEYGVAAFWDSINGAGNYDSNPWVWVIDFKRVPQC